MVLERSWKPLVLAEVPTPVPRRGEVRIAIEACAVCRTDLHVVDGDLPNPVFPIIPGHQIIGTVDALGPDVAGISRGERVGVAWLASTCGTCRYCTSERENLCPGALFTGFRRHGGFADACIADARFVLRVPNGYSSTEAAPLLCGALIGYRALRLAGEGRQLGLYGFGSTGQLVAQIARHQGRDVWTGDSTLRPPVELDAAIIFATDGTIIPRALAAVAPGGTVVCAGIHMTDIPPFPFRLLSQERTLRSVTNLTRHDAEELLALAPKVGLEPHVVPYRLKDANRALEDLRAGRIEGTAVLVMR